MIGHGERVLIVDDEKDVMETYKLWLEINGFQVETHTSPIEALFKFKRSNYDVVLLDIRMPEMTGFELYEEVKAVDPHTKVCFITSFEEYYENLKEIHPQLRDCCFIQKPISMEKLLSSVLKMLRE